MTACCTRLGSGSKPFEPSQLIKHFPFLAFLDVDRYIRFSYKPATKSGEDGPTGYSLSCGPIEAAMPKMFTMEIKGNEAAVSLLLKDQHVNQSGHL